jgi:hypothetical protein
MLHLALKHLGLPFPALVPPRGYVTPIRRVIPDRAIQAPAMQWLYSSMASFFAFFLRSHTTHHSPIMPVEKTSKTVKISLPTGESAEI